MRPLAYSARCGQRQASIERADPSSSQTLPLHVTGLLVVTVQGPYVKRREKWLSVTTVFVPETYRRKAGGGVPTDMMRFMWIMTSVDSPLCWPMMMSEV